MSTALVTGPIRNTQSRFAPSVGTTARPAFRVRRAPTCEPPFDDECDTHGEPRTGSPIRDAADAETPALPVLACDSESAAHLANPATRAAGRYVQVCLEVLNGYRPPSHLRTLAGPIEFADILRHLRLRRNGAWRTGTTAGAAIRVAGERPTAKAPPLALPANAQPSANAHTRGRDAAKPPNRLAAMPPNRNLGPSAFRLLRLRVTEPLPGRAEAVAVIAHAHGSVAIAMRLEACKTSWVCTVFQLV